MKEMHVFGLWIPLRYWRIRLKWIWRPSQIAHLLYFWWWMWRETPAGMWESWRASWHVWLCVLEDWGTEECP